MSRSQKRRVQRLRQLEIMEEEQEQTLNKKGVKTQVWRVKAKAEDESAGNSSTPIQVVRSSEFLMDEFLEEERKLGLGFTSADLLEEIDIGYGDRPRPTFISANLDPEYRQELIKLIKSMKIVLLGSIMKCLIWIDLL